MNGLNTLLQPLIPVIPQNNANCSLRHRKRDVIYWLVTLSLWEGTGTIAPMKDDYLLEFFDLFIVSHTSNLANYSKLHKLLLTCKK